MENGEDDGAGDSEDEHEESLAEEPLADLLVGLLEGGVEAVAVGGGEEREEEMVGVLAFEHEVEAEEDGGEDVEEVREPVGQGGDEIAGGGGEASLGSVGDAVDAHPVGDGKFFDPVDDVGDAVGELGGELGEVAEDRWKADGEEDGEDENDGGDEQEDGGGAGGSVAANLKLGDAVDDGHQDGSEERADVDDQQLLLEGPGEGEDEEDSKAEEDMAADDAARLLLDGSQMGREGDQVELLYWELDADLAQVRG